MSFQDVTAQMEILEWRDNQLSSISEQLDENFHQLVKHLSKKVITKNVVKKVNDKSESDLEALAKELNSSTQKAIQNWSIDQCDKAIERASKQLEDVLHKFPKDFVFNHDIWRQFSIVLPQALNIGSVGEDLAETVIVPSFSYAIDLTPKQINVRSILLYPWPESQLRHIRKSLEEILLEKTKPIIFGHDRIDKKTKKKKPDEDAEIISVKNKIQAIIIQNGQKEIQERVVSCP